MKKQNGLPTDSVARVTFSFWLLGKDTTDKMIICPLKTFHLNQHNIISYPFEKLGNTFRK